MNTELISQRPAAGSNKRLVAAIVIGVVACVGVLFYAQHSQGVLAPTNLINVVEDNIVLEAFNNFVKRYNKAYITEQERAYRLRVFASNVQKIRAQNSLGHSYTLGINKFADLTAEEFRARYLGLKFKKSNRSRNTVFLPTLEVPDSVDWRTKNVVTPIKDQGQCGSCWAFSTTGSLEGLYGLKVGNLQSFSEQQLVDCSTKYGNEGCNGGLMDQGFQYIQDNGIEAEASYPYKAVDQKCKYNKQQVVYKNTGFNDVPENQEDQLVAAIAQQPVSVAIEADTDVFQFYQSGVIDSKSCGTDLDHGVLAVGYTSDYKNRGYFIVKNSWGADWGDKGYVNIARTGKAGPGICGINEAASYPTA
eukprot:TRINITY_DN28_c0_g1_i2.p1 TRINITY_DN28_c0_g1~~TRINITY_DN28_c0_g1_i2.p1  ORF type:complete len:361 (+),score=109.91 TRINITY_DN28_c0_g1_i2:150-1232(+)